MPVGGSTSSAGLPMRSRTQAKYKSFTLTRFDPLASRLPHISAVCAVAGHKNAHRYHRFHGESAATPSPAASLRDQVPDTGAEIVPAGVEREECRKPKQRQADQ